MSDVARRIKDAGFSNASSDWQIRRLEELGKAESEIKDWVQETLQKSDEEMEHIFQMKCMSSIISTPEPTKHPASRCCRSKRTRRSYG